MEVVAEQRRMLQETKADAARLGERDANKDDYFMQACVDGFVAHKSDLLLTISDLLLTISAREEAEGRAEYDHLKLRASVAGAEEVSIFQPPSDGGATERSSPRDRNPELELRAEAVEREARRLREDVARLEGELGTTRDKGIFCPVPLFLAILH